MTTFGTGQWRTEVGNDGHTIVYIDPYGNEQMTPPPDAALAQQAGTPNAAPIQDKGYGTGETGTRVGRPGVDDSPWINIKQPSAYEYGGKTGMAETEEQRYEDQANYHATQGDAVQFRPAYDLNTSPYGKQYGADRGNQQYGLNQLQNTIEGRAPSVAQQQMGIGLAQAMNQQASIAASARGGGAGLVAAQQAAAQQAANLSGNAIQQGGLLRAQESQNAINAYGQQAAGMAGVSAAQATAQGQLAAQQRGLNDNRALAEQQLAKQYSDSRQGVIETQGAYRQAGEAANNGVYQANADRAQAANQASADRVDKYVAAGVQGVGTVAGAAGVFSDVRAKTKIAPAGKDLDATLDGMGSYQYDYKNPARHGDGRQAGTMAQDLAKTPLGASAVAPSEDGTLYVKGPQATGLALAGLARVNERLNAVEGKSSDPIGNATMRRITDPNAKPSGLALAADAKPHRMLDFNNDDAAFRAYQLQHDTGGKGTIDFGGNDASFRAYQAAQQNATPAGVVDFGGDDAAYQRYVAGHPSGVGLARR